jgi:uncharacterized protein involved in outer membrane biogenesis
MTDESVTIEPKAPRRSWPRVLVIVVLALAALVGLYAWAGFKLAPRLITSNATGYVREHYGRELKLRDVRVNPFKLELQIGEMILPDKDGSPMLSWQQLSVDVAGMRSLSRRAFAFEDIRLSAPRIDLVHRADGNWNLLDLVPADAAPESPPPKSSTPRLIVDHFEVAQGAGSFTDRTMAAGQTEQVTDINFSLRDFSTLVSGNHFDLRAASPNIQSIRLEGSLSLDPVSSSGRVEIGGFSLPGIMGTWMPAFRPVAESGLLEFAGDYELLVPQGPVDFKARIAQMKFTDLALRADGATESWVHVPAITIPDVALDLAAQQLTTGVIAIDQPRFVMVLDEEGNLNLLQYLPPEEAAPATAGAAGSKPWQVGVGGVTLAGAEVDVTSHVEVREPLHWRIAPLQVSTGAIALPAKAPIDLRASGKIDPDGEFAVSGNHDLDSGISKLAIDVSGLNLHLLQPFFEEQTQVAVRRGTSGAKGDLVIGGPEVVHFAGTATVGDVHISDRLNGTDLLRWRKATATGVDIQLEPLKISVRDLLLQQLFAQLVIEPNGTTNIGVAFSAPGTMPRADQPLPESADDEEEDEKGDRKPAVATKVKSTADTKSAATEPAEASEPLPVSIRKVRIVDGSMNFTDRTMTPQFATGIFAMNGTVTGLSATPGSVADVSIDGSVDRYAPVTIRGNVNYFAATTLTDLQLSFSNLEMTTFSPYAGKFAGYRIEKGKLNLETNYKIVDSQLDARHHIVIDQLQLGDKVESKEAVSLPLKLAVALLKDRNGVIDLDLPITGSIDDPHFRIGPIVWKMLKNLLVKVATAPFALIGSLFGGGEEMQYIDFAPGQSVLDAEGLKKLEALRKGMVERPGLSVDIPMVQDPARDSPALVAAGWQLKLEAAAQTRFGDKAKQPGFQDTLAANPQDQRKLMVTAYRTQFGKDPTWPKPDGKDPEQKNRDPDAFAAEWIEQQLRPTVVVGEQELFALGKARADTIQNALLQDGTVEPSRVFIIVQKEAPKPEAALASAAAQTGAPAAAPAAPSAAAQVRVELSLK